MKIDNAIALAQRIVAEAAADPKHPVYHGSSHNAQVALSKALLALTKVRRAAEDAVSAVCSNMSSCGDGGHDHWCAERQAREALKKAVEDLRKDES